MGQQDPKISCIGNDWSADNRTSSHHMRWSPRTPGLPRVPRLSAEDVRPRYQKGHCQLPSIAERDRSLKDKRHALQVPLHRFDSSG